MFGEGVVDLVIGLSFLYFLLSLVCSAVNEGISSLFKLRGEFLFRGIRNLLGSEGTKAFFDHPLIRDLSRKNDGRKPSYVPSVTFATAVIDLIGATKAPGAKAKRLPPAELFAGVANEELRRNLILMWERAEGHLDDFRRALEGWFSDAMDRVSGWYRRHVQRILLGVAVVVAGLLNADTIRVAQTLWTTPTARAAVVAQAQALTEMPASDGKPVLDTVQQLRDLPLPLGWSTDQRRPLDPRRAPTTVGGWLIKAFGLLLTVTAIMLGAPFWFDILKKIVTVRASGKPPSRPPPQQPSPAV